VHGTYPLERIAEAIGVLERREATGKVVVRVSGD
jgi:NADPH2:quinone reductase